MADIEPELWELLLYAIEILVLILKVLYDVNKKDDHH